MSRYRTYELQKEFEARPDQILFVGPVGFLVAWMGGDAAGGKEALDALLAELPLADVDPIDRFHGSAALLYAMIGAPVEAQRFVDLYRSEVPSDGDPFGRSYAAVAEAMVKLLNGAGVEAAGLETATATMRCRRCRYLYQGQGFELAGETSRAIDAYEAYLSEGFFDASLYELHFPAPVVHERLGALYEEVGNPEKAAEHYREFARRWAGADPQLQPRVQAAGTKANTLEG